MQNMIDSGRQVALWQLANDPAEYGVYALGWVVVTPDGEDELSGPFRFRQDAERFARDMGWEIVE